MRVHIWPSEHWVDDEAWATIVEVASTAETDIRSHLPTLEEDLYLLVNQTSTVIPETGGGGFTIGPHCIRWDVDPERGVAWVAAHHLIAYRVGTWIADRAIAHSGRSAADLVWEAPATVLALADI